MRARTTPPVSSPVVQSPSWSHAVGAGAERKRQDQPHPGVVRIAAAGDRGGALEGRGGARLERQLPRGLAVPGASASGEGRSHQPGEPAFWVGACRAWHRCARGQGGAERVRSGGTRTPPRPPPVGWPAATRWPNPVGAGEVQAVVDPGRAVHSTRLPGGGTG